MHLNAPKGFIHNGSSSTSFTYNCSKTSKHDPAIEERMELLLKSDTSTCCCTINNLKMLSVIHLTANSLHFFTNRKADKTSHPTNWKLTQCILYMNQKTNLGILAHVSDAQAMAFSFPHQATALAKKTKN